jgi:cell division protein FtsX
MEIDRQKILDEIKQEYGLIERDQDEFTGRELADAFNVQVSNLQQFFDCNDDIKYTRRKALVDGRRQYVYRIERIKNGTQ